MATPDFSQTFDQATTGYSTIFDYDFGTDQAAAGATRIASLGDLSKYFQDYRNGEPRPATRNSESQRYVDFATADGNNLVFTCDALELTATLPNGPPAGVTQTTLASTVINTDRITVADASAIAVGQVLSLGDEQLANLNATWRGGLWGTLSVGDVLTLTLTLDLTASDRRTVVLTQTATAGSTKATLAQGFVDLANADRTLQGAGVRGLKLPAPGAYAIVFPARGPAGATVFGHAAEGSLTWVRIAASRTGTVNHESRATVMLTWVVAKTGNTLTLNHRITAAAGQALFVMPSRMLERTDAHSGASATINLSDTTGLRKGQGVSFGFQNSNIWPITAVTATSITVASSVNNLDGAPVVLQPISMARAAAAVSSSSVISFAEVPADVRVGQQLLRYGDNPNSNLKITAIDRGTSPQTVTIDGLIGVAANGYVLFHEPIHSVEIWTRTGYVPGADNRSSIALEIEADFPDAADIAGWPAFWVFRDGTNTTGLPMPSGSGNEIDVTDTFNYWGNVNANCHQPAMGSAANDLYASPDWSGTCTRGNNLGRRTRKVQLIWTTDRYYAYIDGVLQLARGFVFNNSARAQIAANLAVGSTSTSFNSNGFFPLDWSQFPMKYRVKRMRALAI